MNENLRKKRFTRGCCVVDCDSRVSKVPGIHFYAFPNRPWEAERKKNWIAAVRRITPDGKAWVPNKYSIICSRHFVGGEKSNNPSNEAFNPTIFPSCYGKKSSHNQERAKRAEFRRLKREIVPSIEPEDPCPSFSPQHQIQDNLVQPPNVLSQEVGLQTAPVILDVGESNFPSTLFCCMNSTTRDAETQTYIIIDARKETRKVIADEDVQRLYKPTKDAKVGPDTASSPGFHGFEDVNEESRIKALTGVSLTFFHILLQFVKPKVEHQPRFYRVLNSENRLLLFLMKMKHGLNFLALGCIFRTSNKTASNIFFSILETLYSNTKTWLFWPSREVIRERLPKSFQNYPNCRAIIDCTEIRTDTPPTVEQRVQMYSSYKSAFTVKFLVGISPSGLITFLSHGYGGRSTDGYITNDSGFLDLLEPGDLVLADKGFPVIRSEMLKRQCILVMPPFAVNPQFTQEEVLEGYSIASVRIHVERAIQRIKIWKILDHISIECLPFIDKIMYVSCVLANNKEPLIADNS